MVIIISSIRVVRISKRKKNFLWKPVGGGSRMRFAIAVSVLQAQEKRTEPVLPSKVNLKDLTLKDF